jgi:opacity protein-like surface antigen
MNLKNLTMKKLLAILLAVFIVLPAFSQFKFGLKAGLSTTSISMDQAVSLTGQAGTYTVQAIKNADYGFHGGIFMRLTLLGIYIQPEALFATSENIYNVTMPGATKPTEIPQKINKLNVPVLIGFKLGPIRLNAGPAASVAIGSPKALITDSSLTDLYSKTSFGYQAGLGFDLFKLLTFDLRYEGSLKKYQNQIENLTNTKVSLDNRPNAFLFSIGIIL